MENKLSSFVLDESALFILDINDYKVHEMLRGSIKKKNFFQNTHFLTIEEKKKKITQVVITVCTRFHHTNNPAIYF